MLAVRRDQISHLPANPAIYGAPTDILGGCKRAGTGAEGEKVTGLRGDGDLICCQSLTKPSSLQPPTAYRRLLACCAAPRTSAFARCQDIYHPPGTPFCAVWDALRTPSLARSTSNPDSASLPFAAGPPKPSSPAFVFVWTSGLLERN